MKDDLNVIGIKICNGVSREMTVDHDTVIQPTKMALVSVPEEWYWSQWPKMTVGVESNDSMDTTFIMIINFIHY